MHRTFNFIVCFCSWKRFIFCLRSPRPAHHISVLYARRRHQNGQHSMINYFLVVSRQGKLRLAKWFTTLLSKSKSKIIQDVTRLVCARRPWMCNVIEYKAGKIVYRRYASLFFICEIADHDNELLTLEIIHRYVQTLDEYFGNVCELDLIFYFDKAHTILDELVVAGELHEASKQVVLKAATTMEVGERDEELRDALKATFLG